jgi:Ricin-type beta-trefoil lectin domain
VRSFLRINPRRRLQIGAAAFAVLSFGALLAGPAAGTASAAATWRIINAQTGRCLDSNYFGSVYTGPCNGGNYQEWNIYVNATGHTAIQDAQTGLYLDSNDAGNLYTDSGNGDNYQSWNELYPNSNGWFAFQDAQTGLWLDSDNAGNAYTKTGNGTLYQSWEVT